MSPTSMWKALRRHVRKARYLLRRRTPPRSDAAALVFNIPELLENILLHIEVRPLFVLRRVCKTFTHTMRDSPRLQKAMFLRHIPGHSPPGQTPCLSPLLEYLFRKHVSRYSTIPPPFSLNSEGISLDTDCWCTYFTPECLLQRMCSKALCKLDCRVIHENGSWKDTLATLYSEPLPVTLNICTSYEKHTERHVLEPDCGTLDDLHNMVVDAESSIRRRHDHSHQLYIWAENERNRK